MIFGYLLCRSFPIHKYPLGSSLTLLLIAAAVTFLSVKKGQPRGFFATASPVMLFLLSISMIMHGGIFLRFFSACLFFFLAYYSLGRSFGLNIEKRAGKFFFFDSLKAIFVFPCKEIWEFFPAVFHKRQTINEKSRKSLRNLLFVMLGLFISLIPAYIAVCLLSYDSGFENLITNLFDFDISKLLGHFGSFICGIPIAMSLFSVFFCCFRGKGDTVLTAHNAENMRKKSKFLPVALSGAVFVPILLVYLLFFFSQKEYYLAAFTGTLPEGFSFANYAREGFFNLCVVAALNAALLFTISVFTHKREDGESTLPERIGSILLSLSTLLLITTAMAKMMLYISEYGLTYKRILTSWFMLLLFSAFLCVILRQIFRRVNLTASLLAIFIVFWGSLCLCDVDSVIAEYNTEAYLSGTLDKIDISEIFKRGDSGIPSLVRLMEESTDNETAELAARRIIRTSAYRSYADGKEDSLSVFSFDIPHFKAIKAIRSVSDKLKETGEKENQAYEQQDKNEFPVSVVIDGDTNITEIILDYVCNDKDVGNVRFSNNAHTNSPLDSETEYLLGTAPLSLPDTANKNDLQVCVLVTDIEGMTYFVGNFRYFDVGSHNQPPSIIIHGDKSNNFKLSYGN